LVGAWQSYFSFAGNQVERAPVWSAPSVGSHNAGIIYNNKLHDVVSRAQR
jgi:hypothetical protein